MSLSIPGLILASTVSIVVTFIPKEKIEKVHITLFNNNKHLKSYFYVSFILTTIASQEW